MTNATPHYGHYSLDFYREHASRYADFSQVFANGSHPGFREDRDLYRRLAELAPSGRGLDAGCGAGAREMFLLTQLGFVMFGLDAVEENIRIARQLRPEFSDRLQVGDIQERLPFDSCQFDIVLCNAVIQHIPRAVVFSGVLQELCRVLRPGGVLQLMFKPGQGVRTVVDPAYGSEGVSRSFELYGEEELLDALAGLGLELVEEGPNGEMGGLLYFDDNKPMRHCVFWARKG